MRETALDNATVVRPGRLATGSLAIRSGRVARETSAAFRVDLAGHIIVPGLINAHDHLQLNCIPPLEHADPFTNSYQWIGAFDAHRRRPNVLSATRMDEETRLWHGALKNLLAGVTTVAHHDPWHACFDDPDFPVSVIRGTGWSHSLGLGSGATPRYGPGVQASCQATDVEFPWIIHLAEGTDDRAARELEQLDRLGCLAQNTVIVHGVGMSAADIAQVIERGAAVVWCAASNLSMLGRTLDVRELCAAGRLAIGTDSRLTGSRDLLDELRFCAERSALSPRDLLGLVTWDAARVLRQREIGALEIGELADCVIVRAGTNPYATLLATRRADIRAVVRHGKPMIADPDFAEWFAEEEIDVLRVRVDGRPKLMARGAAHSGAMALESGCEIVHAS
ncbi:MAG: amidohydrolase family protein [bacterium]